MGIRFGKQLKIINNVRISQAPKNPVSKTLYWTKPTGNIGSYPSGYFYAYIFGVYDSQNAIELFEVISGKLPPGIQLNPFSGELEGPLPDVSQPTKYSFTMRVRTTDNRQLYGDFSIDVAYSELVVTWVTPRGLVGEHDLGGQAFIVLKAETNK